MISLLANSEDDPEYIALVSRIISNVIPSFSPGEIFLVQINSWFDYKWLRFSGKYLGALGISESMLTVPPFHPNRVIYEMHATVSSRSGQLTMEPTTPLHYQQRSGENLNRKITYISKSALFAWYSSDTKATDKASLMIYTSNSEDQHGWYASFHKINGWVIHQMKGISKPEMTLFIKENSI